MLYTLIFGNQLEIIENFAIHYGGGAGFFHLCGDSSVVLEIFGKLDHGALGMSDPVGPLELALKPNSVSSINCLLSNFYFCAHLSISVDKLRQVLTSLD